MHGHFQPRKYFTKSNPAAGYMQCCVNITISITIHININRMIGPDCAVMCNITNTHTHTQVAPGVTLTVRSLQRFRVPLVDRPKDSRSGVACADREHGVVEAIEAMRLCCYAGCRCEV